MATNNSDTSREKYYEEILHSLNIFFHDLHNDLVFIRSFASNLRLRKQKGELSDAELERFLIEIEERIGKASLKIRDLMSNRKR